MRSDQVEERGRIWREARGKVLLHVTQHGILILRRELGKWRPFRSLRVGVNRGETRGVRSACRREGAGEGAVDVVRRAGLSSAGAVLVGRDQPRHDRLKCV